MNKLVLTARYAFWLALFFLICGPALAFDTASYVTRRLADALCDLADLAVARGRKLRERMR